MPCVGKVQNCQTERISSLSCHLFAYDYRLLSVYQIKKTIAFTVFVIYRQSQSIHHPADTAIE